MATEKDQPVPSNQLTQPKKQTVKKKTTPQDPRVNSKLKGIIAGLNEIADQQEELKEERKSLMEDAKRFGYNAKYVTMVFRRQRRNAQELAAEEEAIKALEEELGIYR